MGEDETKQKRCEGCQTLYHASCMQELGGCSTLGCSHQRGRSGPGTTHEGPVDVTWGRGEVRGPDWRTDIHEDAQRRPVIWASLFGVSLATLAASGVVIASLDESTVAQAIAVCAVSLFATIFTGSNASECVDPNTRLGRFWRLVELGIYAFGALTALAVLTVAPLALMYFEPPRKGSGVVVGLVAAAFGVCLAVFTATRGVAKYRVGERNHSDDQSRERRSSATTPTRGVVGD